MHILQHILYVLGCADNQYECANGHCVGLGVLCDSFDDCGDRSDETAPECGERPNISVSNRWCSVRLLYLQCASTKPSKYTTVTYGSLLAFAGCKYCFSRFNQVSVNNWFQGLTMGRLYHFGELVKFEYIEHCEKCSFMRYDIELYSFNKIH